MKKYLCYSSLLLLLISLLLITPGIINAQADSAVSNGYYIKYPKKLMARLYLAQKFAPLTISSAARELDYKTNSKLNLGIGASYRGVTLNFAYGFTSLNKDRGGKTTGLDLQINLFPQKWAVDILASFRKGFYIDPKNNAETGLGLVNYYQRPDIKRNITGLSAFRVPNADRFSYRAAITQNDQQIKSAGSILFGGEAYVGMLKGDSAFVPDKVSSSFEQTGITKVNFVSIGPGLGYAYTLVFAKQFFITGSGIATLHLNFSNEENSGSKNKQTTLTPGALYKAALGYNSSDWSVTANIIGNAIYIGSESSDKEYFLPTGIMRFIIAYKFGN
jgi:hypothetical protein